MGRPVTTGVFDIDPAAALDDEPIMMTINRVAAPARRRKPGADDAGGLAWMTLLIGPHMSYLALVAPFVYCGLGMSLFFIPVANVVMGAVPAADQGVASGTNNAVRELGGVLGIAVLRDRLCEPRQLCQPNDLRPRPAPGHVGRCGCGRCRRSGCRRLGVADRSDGGARVDRSDP